MSDFVEKLRAIVGDKGLIVDEQGKHSYVTDWRESFVGNALAVVRPANTQEVADVVRLCAAEKVSVVPQGGNTGLVGGGIPQEKGREIVLSLNRMTRITCLALALLLAACAEAPPRSSSACIPGDPAGPPACQAFTYSMAR